MSEESEGTQTPTTSGDEVRNRHEKELRQLLLNAQRMTNAAQTRSERVMIENRSLVEKYFQLMLQKTAPTAPPHDTPMKTKEICLFMLAVAFSVFVGASLSMIVYKLVIR